jgi:hypothetical protein
MTNETKACETCGVVMVKREYPKDWTRRRFCSLRCSSSRPTLLACLAKTQFVPSHNTEADFWALVEKSDRGCWLWHGPFNQREGHPRRYGRFTFNGEKRVAHQLAWEFTTGQPFPVNLYGCHACDTPGCVRPDHVIPGTPAFNSQDASKKLRLPATRRVRTHCVNGHEFAVDGFFRKTARMRGARSGSRSFRVCRECNRARCAARRRRRTASI